MKRFISVLIFLGIMILFADTAFASGPAPNIKANNSDSSITLGASDTLSITVSLSAGKNAGANCDWWVVESAPDGWYYYNLNSWVNTGSSYDSLSPTYQGTLFDLDAYEVLNTSGLSEGMHTFYFAIDTNMNGTLDFDKLYFDSVVVNVKTLLAKVKKWFYYLAYDIESLEDDIIDSEYDMIVTGPRFTEKEDLDFDIKPIVERIKASSGGNVENKIVIAYIDVGQAESYRYYWKEGWKIGDPEFIVGDDPDMWEGNFPVAFWYDEWQDIWFKGNDAQLKKIIEAGFDGVYLDWVEAYSDDNVMKKAVEDGVDPEEEIVSFVQKIKEYGTALDPGFIVISQNAAELGARDDYVNTIDAIAQEQVWFDGSAAGEPEGDCPLPETDDDIETEAYVNSLSPGCRNIHDTLTESTLHVSSAEYIRYLEAAKRKGLPIFTVDYALEEKNISSVFTTSRSLGFIPFASNRSLNQFVEPR